MNWTERLAKIWNLGNAKLQKRNCGLRFAVCGLPDAKDLYYLWNAQNWQSERNLIQFYAFHK